MSQLSPEKLARYSPFADFSESQITALLAKSELVFFETGSTILRKNRITHHAHYLIDGEIEVRSSFFERYNLSHTSERALEALDELAGLDSQITALRPCQIARFSLESLHAAAADQPLPDYELDADDEASLDSAYVVEDSSLHADWMSGFLHSPLVNHVSARDIQQLLANIIDVPFAAGDTVVRAGEYGDYFYVVKSGLAVVRTDPNGPYRGREFSLMPGSYFGEEALVGNTIRNAEVFMESDGVLGRVDQDIFNTFIRDSLVVRAHSDKVHAILESPDDHSVILDVRLYPEFRQGHRSNSTNLPLAALRERLAQMDIAKHYYITPEGGPRSELATFLMRQAGFNAVLLQDAAEAG